MPVLEPADEKQYWLCRPSALGHDWDHGANVAYRGQRDRTWKHHHSKRCKRCLTVCHEFYDVWGDLERRQYIYPEGYSFSEDEKPSTRQLRLYKITHLGEG